ncbi:hypothetical protein VC83_05008 [Pseudogymnoascus destructans]|uniref:Sodium/calcium exchanger membrane region domain-containing protein n=2 Tax=Pseudogymnoascus destructans TaxID=655981 RepID=L8G0E8_PSED2|nr:uncharacterized protein VC83_05008 [Pseudogymnoascus destructans]ELR06249.1 hypothetical protein GMDG_02044 [Pseudogymnoascus destructans 20631-21]OAF58650.2 hypothetical protein VC83_05008 [Pseudogymnoascus destructans]
MLSLGLMATSTQHRRARSKFSFRSFYISTLLLCAFALVSLVATQVARYKNGDQYGIVQRRAVAELDANRLLKRDEECRLVHFADDKCAFIKANCLDEEAGLLSYLSLYYCTLPNAQPVAFTILVLWIGLLFTTIGIAASDFFCINLSTIATILGMSQSMAGVTFLAFGNGSPDVFSTFAAMSTHSGSMAVGELIGAAGFISGVVAGSMALVREFKVGKKSFVRDVGFFIVAASFSMVMLADGILHLWECCAMIGFYVFYVAVVVTWHWYLQRQRRKRERIALSRGHYQGPSFAEIEVLVEDHEDEDGVEDGSRLGRSSEDFEDLERSFHDRTPNIERDSDDDSDGEGERGRMLATEVSNSMRVLRPRGSRRSTMTPIRPSLIGAMEFRSVLSSLQKARGCSDHQIRLRRYSDERVPSSNPSFDRGTVRSNQSEQGTVVTNADHPSGSTDLIEPNSPMVPSSADDVNKNPSNLGHYFAAEVPNSGIEPAVPSDPRYLDPINTAAEPGRSQQFPIKTGDAIPPSPVISVSSPPISREPQDTSPPLQAGQQNYEHGLAPPAPDFFAGHQLKPDFFQTASTVNPSPVYSPRTSRPTIRVPDSGDSSRTRSLSPVYAFPAYTDSPRPLSSPQPISPPQARLESGGLSSPGTPGARSFYGQVPGRLVRWWPYRYLPAPQAIRSSLFPTFENWEGKNIWDKLLSVVSAPSIFLLAVTLPVVESELKEDDEELELENARERQSRSRSATSQGLAEEAPYTDNEVEPEWANYRRSSIRNSVLLTPGAEPHVRGLAGHGTSASIAISTEDIHHGNPHSEPLQPKNINPAQDYFAARAESALALTTPADWNRWLVAVQIFTAPVFVSLVIWGNLYHDDLQPKPLFMMILYGLIGSLVTLAILTVTTRHDRMPKYRHLFCFLGFIVSIAWISTIANEVVGVLKAFGVIVGISDAILGLTIFAVGNSLGDLVADITVARLGYPVMALSACFGGPMLNILLGVGGSGLYMTLTEANNKHEKHPGRPMKYKPYEIDISPTLLISAVSLLITLVALLILVPLNKWMMTRKIGYGLITLWAVSTVANLVVEITGVWGDHTSL